MKAMLFAALLGASTALLATSETSAAPANGVVLGELANATQSIQDVRWHWHWHVRHWGWRPWFWRW
jgi:hypothetical protein